MRRMTSGMLVFVALLVAGQLMFGVRSVVAAQEKVITWRLAMTWPTHFPILGEAVKKMAADVKRMSGGELVNRIDSANKHKAPFGVLDRVKAGQYEMGTSASYY